MTPRFQSAVMTCEDWDAWHFLGCTSNDEGLGLIDFYELADRIDANIMRNLGEYWLKPVWEFDVKTLHSAWAFQGLCGSELVPA